jgi:GntR family transcriptional regulator/MocR family aminotransferase
MALSQGSFSDIFMGSLCGISRTQAKESCMRQSPVSLRERILLDHTSSVALYRQIYQWLRRAMLDGQLQPGQRLPSTRTLASELGVSRNTASTVYEQLQAEGYIERAIGRGTKVAHFFPEQRPSDLVASVETSPGRIPTIHLDLSPFGRTIAEQLSSVPEFLLYVPSSEPRAFRLGLPALDRFPYHLWAQLIARHARHSLPRHSDYQKSAGYRPLREAIAAHIAVTRGVRCQADHILITAGAQAALDLAVRLLVGPGDVVWMEDPGYPGARAVLESAGAHLTSVPVNADGMEVAVGRTLAPRARLAYVTPSHQFPLGVTMKLEQRLALLQWARQANAWIVEDDYDSEYHFGAHPVEALQGLDRANRVIYIGTFSKVLFPSIRLGYAVVPAELIELFAMAQLFQSTHPPILEQIALADFLVEGHFARHLRRMRTLYAARLEALLRAIRSECGSLLEVHAPQAGMHLVGWLPAGLTDTEIAQRATQQGIEVAALSTMSRQPMRRGGLVLGYAACSEQEIQAGVRILARVLREVG